jgi:putative Mn2+ efflux pump MntP
MGIQARLAGNRRSFAFMTFVEILLIAVCLALDAFAVSLAAGTKASTRGFRPTFRLSFHLGLFQFLMPVLGWFVGVKLEHLIGAVDHWIAFGLLAFVGARMIRAGWDGKPESQPDDPTRSYTLMVLCVATSLDAMAIGLSMAMLQVSIWYPAVVIGVVTSSLSLVGIRLGNGLGNAFGKRMEMIGGLLLCLIGLRILGAHVL